MDLGALIAGKHVLVTGASGGLGEHFARLLARRGAVVSIAARRKDRLSTLAAELRAVGASSVHAGALDVADEESVSRVLSHVESGQAPPLDILVNNAGVASSQPVISVTAPEFDRLIDTNLRGAWLLSITTGAGLARCGAAGHDREYRVCVRSSRREWSGSLFRLESRSDPDDEIAGSRVGTVRYSR